jgi:hypothetical protein
MSKFCQQTLKRFALQCAARIAAAKDGEEYWEAPYRHMVIDNFFAPELATACLEEFPNHDDSTWEHQNDSDIEVKSRTTWQSEFDIPDGIVDAVRILNAAEVLRSISGRIGIHKIVPDPYFTGGGLNATYRGGLLDVHVDGNYHDATGLNRRLNALVYLTPGWEPAWGGEFGLYDSTGRECLKRIAPIFNRLVIFDSNDVSFHGLPDPINFPVGVPRRSIILYYYTKETRPASQITVQAPHSALWVKRGFRDKRGQVTREFS